jgi:hypothetical protein
MSTVITGAAVTQEMRKKTDFKGISKVQGLASSPMVRLGFDEILSDRCPYGSGISQTAVNQARSAADGDYS